MEKEGRMKMRKCLVLFVVLLLLSSVIFAGGTKEESEKPIRIGFSMPLTGNLGAAGKSALLAIKICAEQWNEKGGVLGREIELVYYDDHTNAAEIPAIYTKLITMDKVDFVLSSYGTPNITAAMPVIMEHNMVYPSIFAMEGNSEFNYPYYFSFFPLGPSGLRTLADMFFKEAVKQNPKCKTAALLAIDNEYGGRLLVGAAQAAADAGIEIVSEAKYPPPPSTVDFTTILRKIKASNADCLFIASYPADSTGLIKAAKEINYKPKMFGGAMVGLQYASVFTDLGETLNGVISYGYYAPEPTVNFGGVEEFLVKYQMRADDEGVDPLGYYLPPYAYSAIDTILKAVEATGTLDQKVVGDYILKNGYDTVMGKGKWHPSGERADSGALCVQFQDIEGNGLEQFKSAGRLIIIAPEKFKSGDIIFPFSEWQ